MTSNRLNLYWGFFVAAYALVHIFFLPNSWGEQSISDAGFSSYLTIILLIISLFLVLKTIRTPLEFNYKFYLSLLAYVIVIYILREADFHRLFTDEHITRLKLYTDPNISLQQKIFGGVPLAVFAISFTVLIIRFTKLVISKLRLATPWAVAVFLWGTTFFLSQLADKSDLNDIYYGRVIEEILELSAAGYVLLAVFLSIPLIGNLSSAKN
jgi:hypothetical protein